MIEFGRSSAAVSGSDSRSWFVGTEEKERKGKEEAGPSVPFRARARAVAVFCTLRVGRAPLLFSFFPTIPPPLAQLTYRSFRLGIPVYT